MNLKDLNTKTENLEAEIHRLKEKQVAIDSKMEYIHDDVKSHRPKFNPALISIVIAILGFGGLHFLLREWFKYEIADSQKSYRNLVAQVNFVEEKVNEIDLSPHIILASDYTEDNSFILGMKGAMVSIFPRLTAISYIQLPQNFNDKLTAMKMAAMSQFYPAQSVFSVEYNPGSKTPQLIAFRTKNKKYYIGFKNIVSDYFAGFNGGVDTCVAVTKYSKNNVADNMVGINIPAPATAHLAKYHSLDSLSEGGPVMLYKPDKDIFPKEVANHSMEAFIYEVDGFGNCTLFYKPTQTEFDYDDELEITSGNKAIKIPLKKDFNQVPTNKYVAIRVHGFIQLAVNMGRFVDSLNVYEGEKLNFKIKHNS